MCRATKVGQSLPLGTTQQHLAGTPMLSRCNATGAPFESAFLPRRPLREHTATHDLRSTDPETGVASGLPEAAICVQGFDVQCVLQFTLLNAAGCALHRHTSQVIHRLEWYVSLDRRQRSTAIPRNQIAHLSCPAVMGPCTGGRHSDSLNLATLLQSPTASTQVPIFHRRRRHR